MIITQKAQELLEHTTQCHAHTHTYKHTHHLTAILQASLGEPVALSVVLTGKWGYHKVLQAVPHLVISTTMAKGFWYQVLTGWMPFLSHNQQCQSTEG